MVHIVGYKSVENQTRDSEKVFYDFKRVCNRGEARYKMDSAYDLPGYTVTDDFAAAVCSLPEEYEQRKYLNFIKQWGTVSVSFLHLAKAWVALKYCFRKFDYFTNKSCQQKLVRR